MATSPLNMTTLTTITTILIRNINDLIIAGTSISKPINTDISGSITNVGNNSDNVVVDDTHAGDDDDYRFSR